MIIDTHTHISGPDRLWEHFRDVAGSAPGISPTPLKLTDDEIVASLDEQLSAVGSVGTDLQFVVGRPWAVPTANRESTIMYITQQVNNMFARCVELFPERFVGLATLPQTAGIKPSNCIEELERCATELGFIGCKINCDTGSGTGNTPHLGDEWWYPLYEAMVRLDMPGLLHGGPYYYGREPELGAYPGQVTNGAWGLLNTPKVFEDFPNLKIIAGHGGGFIPYQLGQARAMRLAAQQEDPDLESLDETLSHIYFDTVLYNGESVETLLQTVGPDNVLFGTDKPANGDTIDPLTEHAFNDIKWYIEQIPWISETDKQKVFEGNARKLYTRLKSSPSIDAETGSK